MPGLIDGRLKPPKRSPNNVSSQAPPTDVGHWVAPLAFSGDVEAAKDRLKAAIAAMPRTELVTEDGTYLHFTFTTRVFRWVDDVEFLLDPAEGRIDVRSASRTGYGDMGVNRKRVEFIRKALVG